MAIQIISLLIALLAVIVGPIITYRITKNNLEFQFRSMIQSNWLTKLEDAILTFLNNSEQWIGKYPHLVESAKEDPTKIDENNQEIDKLFDAISASIIKLQLHLDSSKNDQRSIMDCVIQIKEIINSRAFDQPSIDDIRNLHDTIIEKSKKIFKEERQKLTGTFRKAK